MPAWIRNIPTTWANADGWRTDIALTTLESSDYDVADFHLGDGTRITIPMEEMRRALRTANVRPNRMVGPFNVNPHERTVNGEHVTMDVSGAINQDRHSGQVPQIPTNITPELLNDDGSFIEFSRFLVRYSRRPLSADDLRTAHRALRDLYNKTQPREISKTSLSASTPEQLPISLTGNALPDKSRTLLIWSIAVVVVVLLLLLLRHLY